MFGAMPLAQVGDMFTIVVPPLDWRYRGCQFATSTGDIGKILYIGVEQHEQGYRSLIVHCFEQLEILKQSDCDSSG